MGKNPQFADFFVLRPKVSMILVVKCEVEKRIKKNLHVSLKFPKVAPLIHIRKKFFSILGLKFWILVPLKL